MSSLPNNEFLESIFEKKDIVIKAFNGHMVCYIAINNFLVSFENSGGSYNPSQNTLRLTNKFEKCIPSFMESLIADCIQFSGAITKFCFCKGDWALNYAYTSFRDFTKLSSIFKLFESS